MADDPIFPDDPRAATRQTVEGWVSRDGRFYGDDERLARWAGATHQRCTGCGAAVDKTWTLCPACREARERERYAQRPRKAWDGVQMVYSETTQRFYVSPEDACDELDDVDETLADRRIVLCEPVEAHLLTGEEWADDLPDEGGDVPEPLTDAIQAFNAAVKGLILSWRPGRYALAEEEHDAD